MKVLLVDDESDTRLISRFSLSRVGGMEVVEAESGAAALDKAFFENPDIILLDVMMPDMDGPTTLEALRANPVTATIPVIFLTAKVLRGDVERLNALGVHGILVKPFDPMTLPSQILALMAAH